MKYITSTFSAHTSSDHLTEMVFDVLNSCDIPVGKFENLSTDGPNINKGLHNRLNKKLEEDLHPGLLPFDPCNLHKCHNGFHKDILEYGQEVESLAFNLNAWFKATPCKREDFMHVVAELQNKEIFEVFSRNEALLSRHVETRWLTFVPALAKVEQRWEEIRKYFLEFLPTNKYFKKGTEKNSRYKRVSTYFKEEKFILVQLSFIIDVASPFTRFLRMFQSEGPFVHILFKEMKHLLKVIMKRFLKANVVDGLSGKELLDLDVKKIDYELAEMVVDGKTERLLKKLSPYEQEGTSEYVGFLCRNCYLSAKKTSF